MNKHFIVASLAASFLAMPAIAQQGPAGVPGAPALVREITSPTPPPPAAKPQSQKAKLGTDDCSKAKDVKQCKAHQEARKKAQEACKGKTGTEHKQCLNDQAQKLKCSTSGYPALCEQHQKTRELCKNKLGNEHRQCLRDNLTTRK